MFTFWKKRRKHPTFIYSEPTISLNGIPYPALVEISPLSNSLESFKSMTEGIPLPESLLSASKIFELEGIALELSTTSLTELVAPLGCSCAACTAAKGELPYSTEEEHAAMSGGSESRTLLEPALDRLIAAMRPDLLALVVGRVGGSHGSLSEEIRSDQWSYVLKEAVVMTYNDCYSMRARVMDDPEAWFERALVLT